MCVSSQNTGRCIGELSTIELHFIRESSMSVLRSISCLGLSAAFVAPVIQAADVDTSVTYHKDVSRVMQKHCVNCHHEDGIGPFSLETLDDVEANAPMIQEVIRRGTMPPWFAAPEKDGGQSPWGNERILSDDEKSTLSSWVKAGFPEGDAGDAPEPLEFPDGWRVEPDSVYSARPVNVKATGVMPYEYITIETNEDEDRWVSAIEIRPSAPSTVHHVLAFVVPPNGDTSRVNGIDYWAAYAPGGGLRVYPEGYARRLPKGSKLLLSMHYTPTGEAMVDQTNIGVKFLDKAPKYEVMTASVVNTDFEIPAGAERHKVVATAKLPVDIRVLAYLPHTHLRGVAAKYEVVSRSGRKQTLLDVPNYDFNWQLCYEYAKPRKISKGSTLKYTAWYDNSTNNPANPDPTTPVYWGDQTFDEMHLGYVEFFVPYRKR